MVVFNWESSRTDDEGFSLLGSGDLNHAMNADGFDRGTSTSWNWESTWTDTEDFTLSGSGDLNHAMNADGFNRGTSTTYTWELDVFDGYDIVNSINAYSTLQISRGTKDIANSDYSQDKVIGKYIQVRDNTNPNTIIFRGEIRR